jgi:ribosome-associated protein
MVVVSPEVAVPLSELRVRFGPSGGPGGQHANKVATRVEVRFDIAGSPTLPPWARSRLVAKLGSELRVVVDEERSQARNRRLAVVRVRDRLAEALRVPVPRRPTRPSRASSERRLAAKRRRSDAKRRRRGDPDG